MTTPQLVFIILVSLSQFAKAQQRIPDCWINTFFVVGNSLPTTASGATIELHQDSVVFFGGKSRTRLHRYENRIVSDDLWIATIKKQTPDTLIISFARGDVVFAPLIKFDGEFDQNQLADFFNLNDWILSVEERLDYWHTTREFAAICARDNILFFPVSHYGYNEPLCLKISSVKTKGAASVRARSIGGEHRVLQLYRQHADTLYFQEFTLDGVGLGKLWPSRSMVNRDSKAYDKLVESGWRPAKSKPEAKNDSTINLRMPKQKRWIRKKTRIFFTEETFKIDLNYHEQLTGRWSLHDDLFILLHDDRGLIGFASIISYNTPADALQVRLFQPFDTESILFIPWKNK